MAYQNKVFNNEFFKKRHNMHRGKGKEKKKETDNKYCKDQF